MIHDSDDFPWEFCQQLLFNSNLHIQRVDGVVHVFGFRHFFFILDIFFLLTALRWLAKRAAFATEKKFRMQQNENQTKQTD